MMSRRTFRTAVGSVLAAGLALSLTALPAQAATRYTCMTSVDTVVLGSGRGGATVLYDASFVRPVRNSAGIITGCKYTGRYVVHVSHDGSRHDHGTRTVTVSHYPYRYAV